ILDDANGHLLTVQTSGLTANGTYTFPAPGYGLFQSDGTGLISLLVASTSGNIMMSNGTTWASVAQTQITKLGTVTVGALVGLTINNTTIGATTPSTAAFTTLTSNGATTLGTGATLTNSFGTGS